MTIKNHYASLLGKFIIVIAIISIAYFYDIKDVKAVWGMGPPPVGAPADFDSAIMNITNWVLGFIGSIAVLALIWGGVLYTTSAGNETQAETGKTTIKYAIMGLVIAGIAYAFVSIIVTEIL